MLSISLKADTAGEAVSFMSPPILLSRLCVILIYPNSSTHRERLRQTSAAQVSALRVSVRIHITDLCSSGFRLTILQLYLLYLLIIIITILFDFQSNLPLPHIFVNLCRRVQTVQHSHNGECNHHPVILCKIQC